MTQSSEARSTEAHDALALRTLKAAEWDAWYDALEVAFGADESPERRGLWQALTEVDRSLGVWDGDMPVGGAGAYSFRMAVPGGALLPAAGVTMVGVLPTHRRRGVLTALMRHQLDEVHERGESLAVLTASEPPSTAATATAWPPGSSGSRWNAPGSGWSGPRTTGSACG